MIRRLLSVRRDQSGVATIELGLFAPILAAMIIGVVDMSNAFSRKLAVEQAAQRAIEKVMQTTGVKSVAETIVDEVADQANIPDDEKASKISVTYSLECDDEDPQTSSNADTFDTYSCATGTVTEARYIEVQVNDVYHPMFPLHFGAYDSAKQGYPVKATAGMRTK
jgi:Flp pilus assembly protein TadG